MFPRPGKLTSALELFNLAYLGSTWVTLLRGNIEEEKRSWYLVWPDIGLGHTFKEETFKNNQIDQCWLTVGRVQFKCLFLPRNSLSYVIVKI